MYRSSQSRLVDHDAALLIPCLDCSVNVYGGPCLRLAPSLSGCMAAPQSRAPHSRAQSDDMAAGVYVPPASLNINIACPPQARRLRLRHIRTARAAHIRCAHPECTAPAPLPHRSRTAPAPLAHRSRTAPAPLAHRSRWAHALSRSCNNQCDNLRVKGACAEPQL